MLLAIDVGNTQTVVGVFTHPPADGQRARPPGTPPGELADLSQHWRVATVANRTADEHAMLLRDLLSLGGLEVRPGAETSDITGVAVSSSVPAVTMALREMAQRWFPVPLVVLEPGAHTGMPIRYDNPREVGADRIANAVGAFDLHGGPAIVVDLGTATTFDAISREGEYLGGAISPGIEISMEALFAHAAALPKVELIEPRNVIGRSTVESMKSGAVYGYAALVDGLCRRFEDELGPSKIIATGGLSGLITHLSQAIRFHEPWLTLHGLRLVYGRNVDGTEAAGAGHGGARRPSGADGAR
jgi:type III pantothenate kinase